MEAVITNTVGEEYPGTYEAGFIPRNDNADEDELHEAWVVELQ